MYSKESTVNALAPYLSTVYWRNSIEENKWIAAVEWELSKAFENRNRNKLIEKLNVLGMRGLVGTLLKYYLDNRKQKSQR